MNVKRFVLRWLVMPIRLRTALFYGYSRLTEITRWLFKSREHTNYTYHLTARNQRHLAHFLSIVCKQPAHIMAGYMREVLDDIPLHTHIVRCTCASKRNYLADDESCYARRIGWYAIVRATRPTVIAETGVDKGLGSCVLAAALMRNRDEGYPGTYYGTDINPKAGYLLQSPYNEVRKILYGDSIDSLNKLDETIDLFINDSDHSADYEMREYETVASKLSSKAIIIGDNSHCTDKLMDFATNTNRDFFIFSRATRESLVSRWWDWGCLYAGTE